MACEQALLLGDIVKSRRARGTRKETRKRGLGERKAFPQPLARLNRRACSQATHYIAVYNWGMGVGAALTKGEGGFSHCLLFPPPPPSFSFSSSFKLSRGWISYFTNYKRKNTPKNRQLRRPYCVMLNLQSSPWEGGLRKVPAAAKAVNFFCISHLSFSWFYCVDFFVSFILRHSWVLQVLKPRANGCNIVGQQLPTLLDVTCCVRLHSLLHVCCVLLGVVVQSLTPVKLLATCKRTQQLPTMLGEQWPLQL